MSAAGLAPQGQVSDEHRGCHSQSSTSISFSEVPSQPSLPEQAASLPDLDMLTKPIGLTGSLLGNQPTLLHTLGGQLRPRAGQELQRTLPSLNQWQLESHR